MQQARNDVIDGFRGVAILAVLGFHYLVRWAPPYNAVDVTGYRTTFSPLWNLGSYGVHLFFVISGLVITMTVLRSRSALDFVFRRIARLWPALAVCAAVTLLVATIAGGWAITLGDYLASLTFFPEALGRKPVDGAYWSLAVEVKFYAVVAVSFLFLRGRFWIGVAAVGLLSGVAAVVSKGDSLLFSAYWPYFIAGMAAWFGLFEGHKAKGLGLGLAAGVLYAISHPPGVAGLLLLIVVSAMFVMIACRAPMPVLAPLGRISYSLYLLHQTIGVILISALTRRGVPDLAAIAGVSALMVAAAWVSYRFVEKPGAKLVLGVFNRRPRAPPASALQPADS